MNPNFGYNPNSFGGSTYLPMNNPPMPPCAYPPMPPCAYKVGDRVKIIGNSSDHNYSPGIYTIAQINTDSHNGEYLLFPCIGGIIESRYLFCRDVVLAESVSAPQKKTEFDPSKMDSLVIDQKVKDEIVAVLDQHKNFDRLFTEWGLGEVIEYGRGMTFMFWGGPGTGKTWAATCIAKALGMELLILSASEIQSSEPGGANRAIQEAFKEAMSTGKVVFLDECDSLISSRNNLGMVLASEVNTLLTEIEKFEGVAILATNRIEHMDEALERRISLIVEFPKPDLKARNTIWSKMLPKKLPLGKEVNIDELAKHELTGGQIKNVVLQAARMAVSGKSDTVEKNHFDVAITRINSSKNLMGTASRYNQTGMREDFSVKTVEKIKVSALKDFFNISNQDE